MMFTATAIEGAWVIELQPMQDERGFFARAWCSREFAARGLDGDTVQCSIAFNRCRGTIRGMHYSDPALSRETRLVRCTRGSVWDVVVDLRQSSATYRRWIGVELSDRNRRSLYVPAGLAHGYQTLEDDTELFYQMSDYYRPEASRSLRWNDPSLAIEWPLEPTVMSDADRRAPLLQP